MMYLENRIALSHILWTNKYNDSFEVFGNNTNIAREVVDSVLNFWESTITDFNYNVSNQFNVSISINPGELGNGAVTYPKGIDSSGKPNSASVVFDSGWDGHGGGYYFDPIIFSDAYLGELVNTYVRNATPGHPANYLGDFFTVLNHELLHAFGLNSDPGGLFQNSPFLYNANQQDVVDTTAKLFVFDGPTTDILFSAQGIWPNHIAKTGNSYTANNVTFTGAVDVFNSSYAFGRRALVSSTDVWILRDVFDYDINIPVGFWNTINNTDILAITVGGTFIINNKGEITNKLQTSSRGLLEDVNDDGIKDIVLSSAETNAPVIKFYDGRTGVVYKQIVPFDQYVTYGTSIALGDINNDNMLDLIVAPLAGNPHIRIFDGKTNTILTQWFAFGINFNVGANISTGDINNDGYADIVVGASGGNPHIRVYDGQHLSLIQEWFAYDLNYNVGVNVSVGDINADGVVDIVTGATNGNPHLKVFDVHSFFVYDIGYNIGISVAISDVTTVIVAPNKIDNKIKILNGISLFEGTLNVAQTIILPFTNIFVSA